MEAELGWSLNIPEGARCCWDVNTGGVCRSEPSRASVSIYEVFLCCLEAAYSVSQSESRQEGEICDDEDGSLLHQSSVVRRPGGLDSFSAGGS